MFPQDVLNSLKLCYAKLFLEVSADDSEVPQHLLRMLPNGLRSSPDNYSFFFLEAYLFSTKTVFLKPSKTPVTLFPRDWRTGGT